MGLAVAVVARKATTGAMSEEKCILDDLKKEAGLEMEVDG
jgi:hypothetical protein